jgi:hypothetical protein
MPTGLSRTDWWYDGDLIPVLDRQVRIVRTLAVDINILKIHGHGTAAQHLLREARVFLLQPSEQLACLHGRWQAVAGPPRESRGGGKVQDPKLTGRRPRLSHAGVVRAT